MHQPIIDCDIHNTYTSQKELYPYLPEPHLTRVKDKGLGYPMDNMFVSSIHPNRLEAKPVGGVAGADYALLRDQLLDAHGINHGVLTGGGIASISYMPDTAFPSALARAYNDWLTEHWLSRDERLWGAAQIAIQDPVAAAAELYRIGTHPRIVQVQLPAATPLPLAHPFYRPVLQAAHDLDLVVALHFRQPGLTTPAITPIGTPFNYLDYHSLISLPYMSQLVMLVTSGVLEELPNLKILLLEGGFIWAVHLLWRMDKDYKTLRQLAPALTKLPSEYIYRHFKFGVQPVYEPAEARQLHQVIEAGALQRNLVFTSDYPHWDADEPDFIRRFIRPDWQADVFYNNAAAWYKPLQPKNL
jgi:uncharacterized protein